MQAARRYLSLQPNELDKVDMVAVIGLQNEYACVVIVIKFKQTQLLVE